jgi:SAM-dependent methyltransferase
MTGGPDETGWERAMARIDALQRGTELLAVLRGAYDAGLLRALTEPTDAAAIAADLGLQPERVHAALELLAAHEVATLTDGTWRLVDDWLELVAGQAPYDVGSMLGLVRVRENQLADALGTAADFWQLSEADRLVVARGVSLNPASDLAVTGARRGVEAMDGVVAALEAGGAILELGCGVGSRLTALMRAFPRATAVGVELAADLVAYGRRTADSLRVGDRLTYVVGDAASLAPEPVFDLVVWSQFFFPTASRKGALGTARRALCPGGWITMPVIWTGGDPTSGVEAQDLAAEKLLLDVWHVAPLTTTQVWTEVEAAGFIDVRVDADPLVHHVRGRQPGR